MKILIALLVGYTALAEPGRPLYENNCAVCHGDAGLGNGPASAGLNPKPRNLVQDDFKAGDSKEQVLYTVSHCERHGDASVRILDGRGKESYRGLRTLTAREEMIDYLDHMSTYVLVGREQYQVLLDDNERPRKMWCNVLFSLDDRINIGSGVMYTIVAIQKSELPRLWMYRLEKV